MPQHWPYGPGPGHARGHEHVPAVLERGREHKRELLLGRELVLGPELEPEPGLGPGHVLGLALEPFDVVAEDGFELPGCDFESATQAVLLSSDECKPNKHSTQNLIY